MTVDREPAGAPAAPLLIAPLPEGLEWLKDEPVGVQPGAGWGPVLVQLWDFAELGSVRALPYVVEWHRRYADAGLVVVGVHSPRWPLTADPADVGAAVGRLGLVHPIAIDTDRRLWRSYGAEEWPSAFLWDRDGALHWHRAGAGGFREAELAIQELLRAGGTLHEPPEPVPPLRPVDAPGARAGSPTEELLPGGSLERPWVAGEDGSELTVPYAAAGAYASADGLGQLTVTIDGDAANARSVPVALPGLYQLASSGRHERHTLHLRATGAIRLWSLTFPPGVP